jgi:hypothetical protein
VEEKARTAAWASLRRAIAVRLDRKAEASALEVDIFIAMADFVVEGCQLLLKALLS